MPLTGIPIKAYRIINIRPKVLVGEIFPYPGNIKTNLKIAKFHLLLKTYIKLVYNGKYYINKGLALCTLLYKIKYFYRLKPSAKATT